MRIRKQKENIDYSSSIVEMFQFQHEITNDLNEADEMELEANQLMQAAAEKRRYANERTAVLIQIANEYYTLEKLSLMLAEESTQSKKIVLASIITTLEQQTSHTENTARQLLNIDPTVIRFVEDTYSLTTLGKFDIFISGLAKGRK